MPIEVSVVTPYFDRPDTLLVSLEAWNNQTVDPERFELIIVDDGSTHNIYQTINGVSFPFNLRIIHQNNQGPGAARNHGVKYARGDFLIFLDADMLPNCDLVETYIFQKENYLNSIIIGRQIPYKNVYHPFFLEVYRASLAYDLGEKPKIQPFHALAAGNFGLSLQLFNKIGGFDEYFQKGEDVEFAYRAEKTGIKLFYEPSIVSFHNHPKTLESIYHQSEESSWWTAKLSQKHAFIVTQIPIFKYFEPLDLRNDPISLTIDKIQVRIFSLSLLQFTLRQINRILLYICYHPVCRNVRLLRFVHFRIILGRMFIGYRKGLLENPIFQI